MSSNKTVKADIERLIKIAAEVHITFAPSSVPEVTIQTFVVQAGLSADCGLVELWSAANGELPFLVPAGSGHSFRQFSSSSFAEAESDRRHGDTEWRIPPELLGSDGDSSVPEYAGNDELLTIGSDGSGDEIYVVTRPLPGMPIGTVVVRDHETDQMRLQVADFPTYMRMNVDWVEANPDVAFFFGDVTERIFRFPGTSELERQLAQGLQPDFRKWKSTLVDRAIERNRPDLLPMLLRIGTPVGDALVTAFAASRFELAEVLLANGADPDQKLEDGTPILVHLVQRRKLQGVRSLIEHRVDATATDAAGRTALAIALEQPEDWKTRQIVELLRNAGAKH